MTKVWWKSKWLQNRLYPVCIPQRTKVGGRSLPHAVCFLFSNPKCVWPQVQRTIWHHLLSHSMPPIENPPTFVFPILLFYFFFLIHCFASLSKINEKAKRRGSRHALGSPWENGWRGNQSRLCDVTYYRGEVRRGGVWVISRQRRTTELCLTWLLAPGAIKSPTEHGVGGSN